MMHVQGNESTTPLTNQMMNKTDKREMTCHLSVIFGMSKQTIEDSSGLPVDRVLGEQGDHIYPNRSYQQTDSSLMSIRLVDHAMQ